MSAPNPTPDPQRQPDPLPHLPHDDNESAAQLHAARHARASLRRGQYQGKLTCVFGVAKSASRRFASMFALLHDDPAQRRVVRALPYAAQFRAFELRPETALDCPRGGTLHNQAPPSPPTLAALRALGACYVVMLRHPADQISAYTCYMRYLRYRRTCTELGLDPDAGHDPAPWQQHRGDMTTSHFLRRALHRQLSFMADWLDWHAHDEEPGHPPGAVARFEDFAAGPRPCLSTAFRDLYGTDPAAERLGEALQRFDRSAAEQARHELPGVYPHGETGRAGIWRDHFDDDDHKLYRQCADAFAVLHPGAALLDAHYPDWREPR